MPTEKPLFIPLKSLFFNAFKMGAKDTEYRLYGPRWNERTCRLGRQVTLSKGYGKTHRLHGVVIGFARARIQTPDWQACYGTEPHDAACIRISLKSVPPTGSTQS